MTYFYIHLFAYRCLYFLYPWIAEFHQLSTFDADYMIVLFKFKCSFKLGDVLAELMLGNKAAGKKKLNGIIKRSPAHPVLLVLHTDI